MGNMIGILSTVILVSTLATLIFAVGAYVMARRRRSAMEQAEDTEEIPDQTEPLRQAPEPAPDAAPLRTSSASASVETSSPSSQHASPAGKDAKPLFRRLTAQGDQSVDSTIETDKKPGWDWE